MNILFLLVVLPVLLLYDFNHAALSPTFYQWLNETYGKSFADRLLRADIGPGGSFGGGNHVAGQRTKNEPTILVHGITNTIGLYIPVKLFFILKGYGEEEVYGTTYGAGASTNIYLDTMKCSYVKLIRDLIMAVSAFTASKVDIIAYSMGSPIARKAILGGRCVDTSEWLGGPLTALIDTFVGVAGVNHGSYLCVIPFGSCNAINGMHCMSKFIHDINSKTHYEGNYVFTIRSRDDDRVGYQTCGKLSSAINGEDGSVEEVGMNHTEVIMFTVPKQYNLVTKHQA